MSNLPINHPIFASHALTTILEHKWRKYIKNLYLKDALTFFIYLVLFTINSFILFPERIQNSDDFDVRKKWAIAGAVFNVLIFIYTAYYGLNEASQMKESGLKQYLKSLLELY